MTRRMSAILGEYSPAGQGCTRNFSVPPLEYKNSTSYKKYRPNFGLNIQESYGKRPICLLIMEARYTRLLTIRMSILITIAFFVTRLSQRVWLASVTTIS